MIDFYVERQPDELLSVSFFENSVWVGGTSGIKDSSIDFIVDKMFASHTKTQIFEKPNVI